ncbi:hypothetical protein B0H16DRAFT_1861816 [Mycena metata]|uniref:Uncharacterized protein n=1 Tax=Mycena metata TaxID=1033252 RepID=A0AAD7IF43_9AGAR|nr:hypothetical protein B0H16DRAFT_1861816 [Mycena metata]
MFVAWRVKEWVEPWLYRTITMHGSTTIDGYPTFTQSTLLQIVGRNPTLLRSSVCNLYLYLPHNVTKNKSIPNILAHLPTLENLSLVAKFGEIKTQSDLTTIKLIADMHLKRFYGDFRHLLNLPLTAPFFSRITHLGLTQVPILTALTAAALCERLAQISSLTHLAFDHPSIIPHCPELLQNCKSLRVLVFFELGLGEQQWCQEYLALLSHDVRFLAMGEAWYVEPPTGTSGSARVSIFGLGPKTSLHGAERAKLIYEILHASVKEEEEDECTYSLYD